MSEINIDFSVDRNDESNITQIFSEMFERDSRRYNRPLTEEQEVSTE